MTVSFLQDDWRETRPLTLHPTQVAETQGRTAPTDEAGKVPTSAHLDDLCAVEGDPCFFAGMGERARVRLEGGIA